MSQFMTHLIYSSFSAAVLILAILPFRWLLGKKAPRWIACLLWGMVGIRLLIPFSIESELSVLPEIELSEAESGTDSAGSGNVSEGSFGESITESEEPMSDAEPLESKGEPSGETQSGPSDESEEETSEATSDEMSDETTEENSREESTPSEETSRETSKETSEESTVSAPAGIESETPSDTESITEASSDAENTSTSLSGGTQDGSADVGKLVQSIWLCGTLALVLYAGIHYVMLYRRVAVFSPVEEGIRRCERIDMPFVLGVFRPRVYLPYGLEEESERYIIAHERAHIRRLDHVTKMIAFAALALHWFNPFVWLAFVLFCRDIEYACDEKVVRTLSPEERKKYASALLFASVKK